MSEEKRAIVTLHRGVDTQQFLEEMVFNGSGSTEFIPSRSVTVFNLKPESLRNTDYLLTEEECVLLKQDPRVIDVRIGSKRDNGIILSKHLLDPKRSYPRTTSKTSSDHNWGFPSCSSSTDPYNGSLTTLDFQHSYSLTGKGVDVVIQDSGILPDHPEFLDRKGVSRVQLVDWPTVSGLTNITQHQDHYRDLDGHGTHCAGTVAGLLYGWAKDSHIYCLNILDSTSAFGVSESFNLLRNWHINKTNGRPTVINMSWGYSFTYYSNIVGVNYRGVEYTGAQLSNLADYGVMQNVYNQDPDTELYSVGVRVASVDADIQDCIDAGIILVGSAGNDTHYIDHTGEQGIVGADSDNYVHNGTNFSYYHKGATPSSTSSVICVGSVAHNYINNTELRAAYSCVGPRVDIYAPGNYIMSAIPLGSSIYFESGAVDYPLNTQYKATKISGTSMAGPQVAGILATLLEARPTLNQTEARALLFEHSSTGRLNDSVWPQIPTSVDYTNFTILQGSTNRYLVNPVTGSNPYQLKQLNLK